MKPSFLESPSVAWWEPPAVRRRDLDDTGDTEMKNAGITIGMVAIGLGLASIGFNLNGNTATATPGVFNAGPEEPTIVWYDSHYLGDAGLCSSTHKDGVIMLARAWSNGVVEGRMLQGDFDVGCGCNGIVPWGTCSDAQGWFVISSPDEGLNAAADINFDSRVNAEDLGIMLAAWGDAPRNDYPPSDCPLGLIP